MIKGKDRRTIQKAVKAMNQVACEWYADNWPERAIKNMMYWQTKLEELLKNKNA